MTRLLTAALAVSALSLPARADEEIKLDKAPAAAVKAMKDKYPKAQVVKVEKEDDDGKSVIEFTLKDGEKKLEAEFTPEGKFVKEEAEVAEKDVPAAVLTAFKQKYPNAKPSKTEKVTKGDGGEVKYEFDIKDGDKECEVYFAPDGKFIEKKDAKDEKKPGK
ncbi:PepSY-like domain-containing protein [Gemmata sp.]|uniref:PepSY-like domain-containing protein n=1 Tax=Gemmata sp. TaxID=1914242 RepID=UPI003F72ECCF